MSLAEDVIAKMKGRSVTLATCESITGGGLGAELTSVPGASAVFMGALVTYARELKNTLAGVDQDLIDHEGVVNELTAIQMAIGAQTRCDADWAIATTGVAGPTLQDGVEVGTVWFAVVGPKMGMSQGPQFTEVKHFEGDRNEIRGQAIEHALEMLLRILD